MTDYRLSRIFFIFCLSITAFLFVNSNSVWAVTFNDGMVHIIDSSNSFPSEEVRAYDGPGGTTTTVNIVSGGEIGTNIDYGLEAFDSSQINMSGGQIGSDFRGIGLVSHNNCTVTISGCIIYGYIGISGDSKATISDVTAEDISVTEGGYVNVSGGLFRRLAVGQDGASAFVSCGDFGEFLGPTENRLSGPVVISGGVFHSELRVTANANVTIIGGEVYGPLIALNSSTTTIFGNDFNFPAGDISATSGNLYGTLADGTPLTLDFERAETASIILVLSPLAPEYIISGFEPPFNNITTLKNINRSVPLKTELLTADGLPITDADISHPPILVLESFSSASAPSDSTVFDGLPPSQATDGIHFVFNGFFWRFNLKIKDYCSDCGPGLYNFMVKSGDESEYLIDSKFAEVTFAVRE